jgi:hypothetical protein
MLTEFEWGNLFQSENFEEQDGNEKILREVLRKLLLRNLIGLKWNIILNSDELWCNK